MSTATNKKTATIINGVDTEAVMSLAGAIQNDAEYGKFQFRASNQWINGVHTRSSVKDCFLGGKEYTEREQALITDNDQTYFLAGSNIAPNPVEHLLSALDACLNVTLVYHASVQGINLESVETHAEGDMDARGFFGISNDVCKGYEKIRVNMKVKSDADEETLTQLAMYSPVYEMISKAVDVDFSLTKV